MKQPDDDELRAAFDRLRNDDRTRKPAPEFRAVWDRAEARARTARRTRTMAPLWIAAAAVVVLAFGAAVRRHHDRDAAVVDDSTALVQAALPSLSTWTPPTASLLNTSGRALLAPRPILSSILDGAAPAPVQRKGD